MKHKELNVILKVYDSSNQVRFLKYRGVTNVVSLIDYLSKMYIIDYLNLYDKKTKEKLQSISYKNYLMRGLYF